MSLIREYEYRPTDYELEEQREQAAMLQDYIEKQAEINWVPPQRAGTVVECYGRLRKAVKRYKQSRERIKELADPKSNFLSVEAERISREADSARMWLNQCRAEYRKVKNG